MEGDGHGNADGEVGEDAQPTVVGRGGECQVVAELVDGEEEVVIEERAEEV